MAHLLTAHETGLACGTEVTIVPSKIPLKTPLSPDITISLSGERSAPITLTFDRAGYNHYDEVYAYCFKLPSHEELWIEFPERLTTDERLEILRSFLTWK
jgi:hypothetical protein